MYYLLYTMLVFFSLAVNIKIAYILSIAVAYRNIKGSKKLEKILFSLAAASIIMPDNYSTELFLLLYFAFSYLSKYGKTVKRNKYSLFLGLFLFTALLSTMLNSVPGINILFAIMSFLPFFAFILMLGNVGRCTYNNAEKMLDDILFIEVTAMIINFVLYHGIYGDDWSRGTFNRSGGSQAQLCILAAYLTIYYFCRYRENRKNRNILVKAILSFVVVISTNCWSLTVLFFAGVEAAFLVKLNRKRLFMVIVGIVLLPVALVMVLKFAPGSISAPLKSMLTDRNYFSYRFHKAEVYAETFIEIPGDNIVFAFIGNGVGNYNSRAALICTGQYTDFYNKLFGPSTSDYTDEYIMDYLEYAKEDGGSDYGSVLARPYSSILSLMGECGYLGVILFVLMIISFLKKQNFSVRTLIIVWLSFCFIENYFEYPKILMMLYVSIISAVHVDNQVANQTKVFIGDNDSCLKI